MNYISKFPKKLIESELHAQGISSTLSFSNHLLPSCNHRSCEAHFDFNIFLSCTWYKCHPPPADHTSARNCLSPTAIATFTSGKIRNPRLFHNHLFNQLRIWKLDAATWI